MKKLVILTGAGISAESGISTFRDSNGLWEQYDVMDVASADGFRRNPDLIHRFYNDRRAQLANVAPNTAHLALAELERDYEVYIITQNVDDLHERAGSSNIIHLHGELMKVRAIDNDSLVWKLPSYDSATTPDTIKDGHHVRPHIVFFQEAVPMIEPAAEIVSEADIFVIIGTSMQVYPAAGLIQCVRPGTPIYFIDPHPAAVPGNVNVIAKPATEGVADLAKLLRQQS